MPQYEIDCEVEEVRDVKIAKIEKNTGKLIVETGLHIGGTNETIKIGGIDSFVIRDGQDRVYIPGTSIKGKLRYLLEVAGNVEGVRPKKNGHEHTDGRQAIECPICRIFGSSAADSGIQGELIVRDAYPETRPILEAKSENYIDREEIRANPRTIERVSRGSEFQIELVMVDWGYGSFEEDKALLEAGIKLLEENYLGGSGTRGYGKVRFELGGWSKVE